MANKHMKKMFNISSHKETQIETRMRYYYAPVKTTTRKKIAITPNRSKNAEISHSSLIVKWYQHS